MADGLRDAFVRVELRAPRPEPGLAARVREILPGALDVRCVYAQAPPALPSESTVGAGEFKLPEGRGLDPATRLRAFYRQTHGADLPESISTLFTQLYEETLRETA